jgi:hypothetical protein
MPRIVRVGPSNVNGASHPASGTRLRRAVDPGASADPAGLTARARPKARPGRRAANLSSRLAGSVGRTNAGIICNTSGAGAFVNKGAAIGGDDGSSDSCDEFPFAATYQSGALAPGVTNGVILMAVALPARLADLHPQGYSRSAWRDRRRH